MGDENDEIGISIVFVQFKIPDCIKRVSEWHR